MEFLPWEDDSNDTDYAWFYDVPEEIDEDSYKILEDKKISDWMPEGVVVNLSPDKGVFIPDFIPTVTGLHVVSDKLRKILTKEVGEYIEFYNIVLKNAKGRIVDKKYHLAHLRLTLDCMDKDKSDVTYSAITPEQAMTIRKLALNEKKIPKEIKLFKLKEYPSLWLTRRDLAIKIYREDNNCRGMLFTKLSDYGEMWRAGG